MVEFDDLTPEQFRAYSILDLSYWHSHPFRRRLARQKLRELLDPQISLETRDDIDGRAIDAMRKISQEVSQSLSRKL